MILGAVLEQFAKESPLRVMARATIEHAFSPAALDEVFAAVLALAGGAAPGGRPLDLALINRVRREYLGLGPVAALAEEGGLGSVIEVLRGE